jgi:hypothetical protein
VSSKATPQETAHRSMAWRSHGHDNDGLVEALTANGIIRNPRVKEAMLSVERAHFAADQRDVRDRNSTHRLTLYQRVL